MNYRITVFSFQQGTTGYQGFTLALKISYKVGARFKNWFQLASSPKFAALQ